MTLSELTNSAMTAFGLYATLLIYVRIVGLRTFAEMTAVDLSVTVAVGSIMASTILPDKPRYVDGAVVLALLFTIQYVVSKTRRAFPLFKNTVENSPLLLMKDGVVLTDNLARSKVTKDDLMAKLREANALDISKVRAVVFESTGDISVLHGESEVSIELLEAVKS